MSSFIVCNVYSARYKEFERRSSSSVLMISNKRLFGSDQPMSSSRFIGYRIVVGLPGGDRAPETFYSSA
jgi:hypothetical protein